VSQYKTLTNLEKGKTLREIRNRLNLTQRELAKELHIDSTYLSQLENGGRPVDDFYLEQAREIEKSNKVQAFRDMAAPTAEMCLAYLKEFLERCDEPAKIVWAYIELKEHFPLTKFSSSKFERELRGLVDHIGQRDEKPQSPSSQK
jgi:transcriptional regulator with XRE-family HTH domain